MLSHLFQFFSISMHAKKHRIGWLERKGSLPEGTESNLLRTIPIGKAVEFLRSKMARE
jgi:hypothetical protein